MTSFQWLQWLIEYVEGARDEGPGGFKLSLGSPLWGLLWIALMIVIVIFSGQSSKFIYIDF